MICLFLTKAQILHKPLALDNTLIYLFIVQKQTVIVRLVLLV
jgi:hypothetical protein